MEIIFTMRTLSFCCWWWLYCVAQRKRLTFHHHLIKTNEVFVRLLLHALGVKNSHFLIKFFFCVFFFLCFVSCGSHLVASMPLPQTMFVTRLIIISTRLILDSNCTVCIQTDSIYHCSIDSIWNRSENIDSRMHKLLSFKNKKNYYERIDCRMLHILAIC